MLVYDLISPDGEFIEFRRFDTEPEGIDVAPHKPRLLPRVEIKPAYDPPGEVREGPVHTVEDGNSVWTWTVRDKTEEEILADFKATVPQAIDMRRVRLKLDSEGRLDAVDAYVASQPNLVKIEWEYATELRRTHPMVAIMGFFFGLDEAALDQWFIDAGQIGPTETV